MIAQQGMSIEPGGVIFLFVSGVLVGIAWQLPFLLAISLTLFFTSIVMLPMRLNLLGLDGAATGIFLATLSLVAVVAAMMMPKVSRALGEMPTLVLVFVLYTASLFVFQQAENMTVMSSGAVLAGMGFGFSIPLLNHMTVERSHASVRGRNLSYLTMAILLGQFLTSFLEFLPGDGSNVSGFAAVLGPIFAVLYLGIHLRKHDSRHA